MEYNFIEPMNKHLSVKIGRILDPKSWVIGKDTAASDCRNLALRMSLDVYLRTCIAIGKNNSIEGAIEVLGKVGYDEGEIRKEARNGHFSLFFFDM